jgi:uncharacterized protein YegP (UPF0339 family)
VKVRRTERIVVLIFIAACLFPAASIASGPPSIEYFAPSPLRNHEATLRFAVDPEGLETEYEVEYGRSPGGYNPYHYLWDRTLPAGEESVMRKAEIPAYFEAKLLAGTEYHWRVVAKNAAGTTEGPDQQFTTPNGPRPQVVTGAATAWSPTSASFEGTIDPEGFALTGCRFRYVPLSTAVNRGFEWWAATEMVQFGEAVPCEESLDAAIGSGSEAVTVHGSVSGFTAGPYRFRLEAENEFEDAAGGGVNFGVPGIVDSGATSVGATEATVYGTLEKFFGENASYHAEYAIADSRWQRTASLESPLAVVYPNVSVQLICLQPGTEYRYRLAASNEAGTLYGPEGLFSTGPGTPTCATPATLTPPSVLPSPSARSSRRKPQRHKRHRRHKFQRNTAIVALR